MHIASIVATGWAYHTRTLATGTPAAPTDRAERISQAGWQYVTRTLQDGPAVAPGRPVSIPARDRSAVSIPASAED